MFEAFGVGGGGRGRGEGIKSGTKLCQPNMGTKHTCINLKIVLNVDYRLFL